MNMRYWTVSSLLLSSLSLNACTERARHSESTLPAPVNTQLSPPSELVKEKPSLFDELQARSVRERCNRVTGCQELKDLLKEQPEQAALAAAYALSPQQARDGFYRLVLAEELGTIASPVAEQAQVELLKSNKWELAIAAGLGLSKRGTTLSTASREALTAAFVPNLTSGDLARNLSLLVAFMNARVPELPPNHAQWVGKPRDLLLQFLPKGEELKSQPHPQLHVLVSVVAHAKLNERLDIVRHALSTANRFVSETALDAAVQFQDTGSIGWCIALLEHQSPILKRKAAEALTEIVGARYLSSAEWNEFAKRQGIEVPTLPERY